MHTLSISDLNEEVRYKRVCSADMADINVNKMATATWVRAWVAINGHFTGLLLFTFTYKVITELLMCNITFLDSLFVVKNYVCGRKNEELIQSDTDQESTSKTHLSTNI
jgi:hypothetical protein